MSDRSTRWRKVSDIFDRVIDLDAAERERALDALCAGDAALRREVEALVRADAKENPVDRSIAAQASAMLLEGDPEQHYGQCFGPYRIIRLLGQGGMGRVYLAERHGADFSQVVALKLIGGYGHYDAALARQRFFEERRILAKLIHPNIARFVDGGVGGDSQPWFAMEFVDGMPIDDWCREQRLSVQQRLGLFAAICDAVDHAHRFLVVHRDLKPGNLLVDAQGQPKVLDFGIAKLVDESGSAAAGSTIVMTPDYAAPEQMRGEQISTASDVYALGAVLFQLLTGCKPFPDALSPRDPPNAWRAIAGERDRLRELAGERATSVPALRTFLRGDIDRVLRAALDPNPARRYGSAAQLGQDLRAIVGAHPISLRSDRAYRTGVFLRRHRIGVAAAALAVIALLATTGLALLQTKRAREEARTAESVSALLVSAFEAANPVRRGSVDEPTAKDVLDASAANIDTELREDNAVKARMQLLLGNAYYHLGYPERAAALLQAAYDGFSSKQVDQPDQAVEALTTLIEVTMELGARDRAVTLAREVLARRLSQGGTKEQIVGAYQTLGTTLIATAKYREAERILSEAHIAVAELYGDTSPELANSYNTRGVLATSAGRPRRAELRLRKALEMRSALAENAAAPFASRSLLAIALGSQGRFAEAEGLLLQNLAIVPSLYQADSVYMALLYQRMALLYRDMGDLARARATIERSFRADVQDEDAVGVAIRRIILAEILDAQGDVGAAAAQFEMADATFDASTDAAKLGRLRAQAKSGMFKLRHRLPGADARATEDALIAWMRSHEAPAGDAPPDLAEAMFLHAELMLLDGRARTAALTLPAENPESEMPLQQARRHYFLGRQRALQGRQRDAAAHYRQALEIVDRLTGAKSATAASWRVEYAATLVAAGDAAAARTELSKARRRLEGQVAADAAIHETLRALERRVATRG